MQVWTVGEGFGIGSEFRQTCCAANNFRDHQVLFFVGSSAPVSHGTRIVLTRRKMRCGLTSADSGLQLDLEIALNGVSAKIQPPPAFQPGRRCVETSGHVIEDDFTSTPDSHIWDLSPMRLGAAKTAGNRRNRRMSLRRPASSLSFWTKIKQSIMRRTALAFAQVRLHLRGHHGRFDLRLLFAPGLRC